MTQLAFSTFFSETKMPELIVLSSTDSGIFSFIKNEKLLTQTQFCDQRNITVMVFTVQVGQQALTAVNHTQQTATTVVVFGVGLEVRSQLVDTGCQQCNLHFWATGVTGGTGVVFDNSSFDAGSDHVFFLLMF
jgi:hypothetical protein